MWRLAWYDEGMTTTRTYLPSGEGREDNMTSTTTTYRQLAEAEAPDIYRCSKCGVNLTHFEDYGWLTADEAGLGSFAGLCVDGSRQAHTPELVGKDERWVARRLAEYRDMEALVAQLIADDQVIGDEAITTATPRLVDNGGVDALARAYGYRRHPVTGRWLGGWCHVHGVQHRDGAQH